MYVCIYVCMYVCVYVCMYASMHPCLCLSICMYVCMYVRLYVVNVCILADMYVQIYICVCLAYLYEDLSHLLLALPVSVPGLLQALLQRLSVCAPILAVSFQPLLHLRQCELN